MVAQVPKKALISVYDKSNLEVLLPCLKKHDYALVASGKTAAKIRQLGYDVMEVAEITGFPESPDGLLKTLHPRIHGGFLLDPNNRSHQAYMQAQMITPIDLLVSNLYPFQEVAARRGVALREAAESIDIGGPALIRSAAKAALLRGNVLVITDPSQYQSVVDAMERNKGAVEHRFIVKLALAAFELTERYDAAIHQYVSLVSRE